jgi:ubiquinol-cytochrome c reductase iron-sulfur subunit
VLLLARGRRARRRELPAGESPFERAELLVLGLLGLATLSAAGFINEYALDADTQLLGLALGLSLAFLAAACVVAGKTFIPSDEEAELYANEPDERTQQEVVELVHEADRPLTRKRLLATAATGAGLTLGAALVVPLASLGPVLGTGALYDTPWRAGRRLVGREGKPISVDELAVDGFLSAFAEGASRKDIGSALIVVRLREDELDLPEERRAWAPEGILAFSKICTHAGCAVAMFRTPLYPPTSPSPALVCPCHYSTFDPRVGGKVIFGPAGRDLPQLPLRIDSDGHLAAGGNFSGPVGPSWWGVRLDDAR